jgi:hypothetical protein
VRKVKDCEKRTQKIKEREGAKAKVQNLRPKKERESARAKTSARERESVSAKAKKTHVPSSGYKQ